MIELPENYVLARQVSQSLAGKTIRKATANAFPHKFAWYSGDPAQYHSMLEGKTVEASFPGTGYTCGSNTAILCGDMLLALSTPIKYHVPGAKLPVKHQLLLEFEDGSAMSCTVQMWGAMLCVPAVPDTSEGKKPSPLEEGFDAAYFSTLLSGVKPSLSAKEFLATEQRIPGLGNGVLQDILFNAHIHPRTRLEMLDDGQLDALYLSVKSTLRQMVERGGRDTEKDLFNHSGDYRTKLSAKTVAYPCLECGGMIVRQAYLGGNVYFCPHCQPQVK